MRTKAEWSRPIGRTRHAGRKASGAPKRSLLLASARLLASGRRRSSRATTRAPGVPACAARATGARARAPEMAFMFMERNAGTSTIDYPVGGSRAIVDALVRGIRKHGGRVLLRAPVEQILVEGARRAFAAPPRLSPGRRNAGVPAGPRRGPAWGAERGHCADMLGGHAQAWRGTARAAVWGGRAGGRAVGVRLARRGGRAGEVVRAAAAVVSNASAWDTQRLLPPGAAPAAWRSEALQTPRTGSFVHLHAGAPPSPPLPPGCAWAGGARRTPNMQLCSIGRCIRRAVAGQACARAGLLAV